MSTTRPSAPGVRPNLRHWPPRTHSYCGQAVGLYDDALLLVDGSHIAIGDRVLLGSARRPSQYRVRHVAYYDGDLAYWKVRLERLTEAG